MRYVSVCSGIEAATVAWHPLGWEPVAFSEIEPFPSAVLACTWPDVPNLGDMTQYEKWKLRRNPDVLVGGTPCQAFSVAGLREGLESINGQLMLTYVEIAAKFRPDWLVWENVPGCLSSGDGQDFAAFLGALTGRQINVPDDGWSNSGATEGIGAAYGIAWRVLDAQNFGVAQRRRRVFVIGYLGDWRRAAAVLFEQASMCGNPAPSREKGKNIARDAGKSTSSGSHWDGTETHPSLNQSHNTGGIGASNQEVFSQRGGGLVPATVGTICADSHPGSYTGQDAYTGRLIPAITGPLTAGMCKGPRGTEGAESSHIIPTVIPIHDQATRHAGKNGDKTAGKGNGLGIGKESDPAPTLTKGDKHAVAFSETARTITARQDGSTCHDRGPDLAISKMQVRRLTPIECERLQGFPDNHTAIAWRGKEPADCPDGPRYKACGNSMAVPVIKWLGERIEFVESLIETK
jgi:DNA (cytosine-5)-methyltransferase 1